MLHFLAIQVLLRNKVRRVLYGDANFAQDSKNSNIKYRHKFSNYFASLSVWWLNGLFSLGYQRPLELSDLGELPTDYKSHVVVDQLQDALSNDLVGESSEHNLSFSETQSQVYRQWMCTSAMVRVFSWVQRWNVLFNEVKPSWMDPSFNEWKYSQYYREKTIHYFCNTSRSLSFRLEDTAFKKKKKVQYLIVTLQPFLLVQLGFNSD